MRQNLIEHLRSLAPFYYYPNFGNYGDLLIAEGTRQFFKRNGIAYHEYNADTLPEKFNLVYAGGARFVAQWAQSKEEQLVALLTDPRVEQCVILPHSYDRIDGLLAQLDGRHHLYSRNRTAYEYCLARASQCHCYLEDDMAFNLNLKELSPPALHVELNSEEQAVDALISKHLFERMHLRVRKSSIVARLGDSVKRIAFLLREDAEKASALDTTWTFDIAGVWCTSGREMVYNGEMLRQFSSALRQADVIVSDRLHVCIMAYLSGLEVYMLDNSYGKLSGVYELSMQQAPNVHLLPNGELNAELQSAWEKFTAEKKIEAFEQEELLAQFESRMAAYVEARLQEERMRDQKRGFALQRMRKRWHQSLLKRLVRPSLRVRTVRAEGNKLIVTFKPSQHKDFRQYFEGREFVAEYSVNIEQVPESLLVVPFVANVLPIIWLTNARLIVPKLDKAFYDSIPEFKQGYIDMSPELTFAGDIKVGVVEDNTYTPGQQAGAFFSGGVDAFCTLLRHVEEAPTLITLWGADVHLDDAAGWKNVHDHVLQTARQFQLPDPIFVKTNFRTMINVWRCNQLVRVTGSEYWHHYQHGISIISHAAPICLIKKLQHVYIASSFTAADKEICASDPTNDNHVRMASCATVHDGYEWDRQQKIASIAAFVRKTNLHPHIRVCWIQRGGKNCCRCEKCLRTIYGFLAEGMNPKLLGFDHFNLDDEYMQYTVLDKLGKEPKRMIPCWQLIQRRFKETGAYRDSPAIHWIYTADLGK